MSGRRIGAGRLLAAAMALTVVGCGEGPSRDVEIGIGEDTLQVEVPEEAAERLERTGRRLGGRVGDALEETGQAIERAGERIREEVGEDADAPVDTPPARP